MKTKNAKTFISKLEGKTVYVALRDLHSKDGYRYIKGTAQVYEGFNGLRYQVVLKNSRRTISYRRGEEESAWLTTRRGEDRSIVAMATTIQELRAKAPAALEELDALIKDQRRKRKAKNALLDLSGISEMVADEHRGLAAQLEATLSRMIAEAADIDLNEDED